MHTRLFLELLHHVPFIRQFIRTLKGHGLFPCSPVILVLKLSSILHRSSLVNQVCYIYIIIIVIFFYFLVNRVGSCVLCKDFYNLQQACPIESMQRFLWFAALYQRGHDVNINEILFCGQELGYSFWSQIIKNNWGVFVLVGQKGKTQRTIFFFCENNISFFFVGLRSMCKKKENWFWQTTLQRCSSCELIVFFFFFCPREKKANMVFTLLYWLVIVD